MSGFLLKLTQSRECTFVPVLTIHPYTIPKHHLVIICFLPVIHLHIRCFFIADQQCAMLV